MPETITDRKIRVGIVGCGRISSNHMKAIDQFKDDLELVAVCDTCPERLEAMETSAARHVDLKSMLDSTELDLVSICTPSGQHPQQVIEVVDRGIHAMTEKPMATRWNDGLRMVRAADKADVHLFVVKQNRFNATLQLLKKAIEQKRFGRIHMVNVNVFWTRPQEYYDSAKWRGTWELDGGAFMNQASHYVDLLDWLVGPVECIHAMTATRERDIEVEDTGVMNIRWRNGALGSMNVTMLAYPKNLEGSITILGETGSVIIGGMAVNEILKWEFADERDYDAQINDASYQVTSIYGFGHPAYYHNVIDVLRGNAEPETDGREGLKSLELLIATYMSARDNKTVGLPLHY
ncbi:MAG: oxidoreductase [Phycisphaerae bacterium]|nr:oxidoreductase [Phycisphaerae bacterium]